MNKRFKFLPLAAVLPVTLGIFASQPIKNNEVKAAATGASYEGAKLPTTIDLNDCGKTEIQNYYSALNSLDESERKGENLLKNLKPILSNNQKYYNYDSNDIVWKMYEITDRDWFKSPASELGDKYDEGTNIITNYSYSSNSSYTDATNPYIKSYYMDVEQENMVRAWGDHTQLTSIGINREHLWPKSEGFDDKGDNGGVAVAAGARGDPMHLVAANGKANNMHNNNYYGYVNTDLAYEDSHDEGVFSGVGHNYLGKSKTYPEFSGQVFEPQDCDKGDIARAMFYMAARYNDIAGTDTTINANNPNLRLTNDLDTWKAKGFQSSQSIIGYLGCLDDLLEWNALDPVDEYEIHRNNILFRNFTNNRNPFIDYPQWANAIWGDGNAVNPSTDKIATADPIPVEGVQFVNATETAKERETIKLKYKFTPFNATNRKVTWSSSNLDVATVDTTGKITCLKEGTTVITITTVDGGFTATCELTVEHNPTIFEQLFANGKIFGLEPMTFAIVAAIVVVVLIIIIVIATKGSKKQKKALKKVFKEISPVEIKTSSSSKKTSSSSKSGTTKKTTSTAKKTGGTTKKTSSGTTKKSTTSSTKKSK